MSFIPYSSAESIAATKALIALLQEVADRHSDMTYEEVERVKALLKRADPDAMIGKDPFIVYCAYHQNLCDLCVPLLVEAGADVDKKGRADSVTALMMAAWGGHTETTKLLIDAGADIEAESRHGTTPLIGCCFSGPLRVLIDRGAMLHKRDNFGHTAMDNAVRSDFSPAIDILNQALEKERQEKTRVVVEAHMDSLRRRRPAVSVLKKSSP